jgi:hypothetical protein
LFVRTTNAPSLSLSATFLRNHVIAGLRSASDPAATAAARGVGNGFVYTNPTVHGLARALLALVHPDAAGATGSAADSVRAMIDQYTRDMPPMREGADLRQERATVLLTGSTGGLGAQLLAAFVADKRVEKVYALNRPSTKASSLARHQETFRDRSARHSPPPSSYAESGNVYRVLDEQLLTSSKLVFAEGDASQENLGLSKDLYDEVCRKPLLARPPSLSARSARRPRS